MSKLMFKIYRENWSCIEPGSWFAMEWKIYDDYSVNVTIFYGNQKVLRKVYITEDLYDNIVKNFKLAKKINKSVIAYDGDAWRFTQFKNNKINWIRELDYIYGIKPLEYITNQLLKMID